MSVFALCAVLLAALCGCGAVTTAGGAPSGGTSPAGACQATSQDRYVYHPARLVVLLACLRVTGTVVAIRPERDGDYHVALRLDALSGSRSMAANRLGELVIEAVCERTARQADAVPSCAMDRSPLAVDSLAVGGHVWMEGRYVTDSGHGGWAELHPLYRWGVLQ